MAGPRGGRPRYICLPEDWRKGTQEYLQRIYRKFADLPVIVQWMILAGMGVLALLVVLLGMTWACSNAPATDRPYLSSNSAVSAMGMSISNCSLERLPAAQSIAKTMQLAFYEHMEAQLAGNPELSAPAAFGAAAVEHTLSYVVGSWLMYIIIHLRSNQTAYLSMLLMIAASVLSTSASIRKAASELKISQRTARLASRAASAIFFISISVSVLAAKQLGLDWATEVMLGSRWLAKLASLCAKFKKTLKAEDVLTARDLEDGRWAILHGPEENTYSVYAQTLVTEETVQQRAWAELLKRRT